MGMAGSEWTERIVVVDAYLKAQYALMQVATGGEADTEILCKLDDVRRRRIAFTQFPPSIFQEASRFSTTAVEEAIVFLELSLKARQNDTLLADWLKVFEFKNLTIDIDRKLGLAVDPDHDVFVVGGANAVSILSNLRDRQYQRLLDLQDLPTATDEADRSSGEGIEQLDRVLRRLPNIISVRPERVHVLGDLDPALSSKVLSQVDERLKLLYVGRNTTELMAQLWTTQLIRNLPALVRQGRSLLNLKDTLRGRPAVVVGAGPSLDEAIPLLCEVANHVTIIVAFKALRAVVAGGISPDFVVCLDPKQKVRHLEGVDLSKVGCFVIEAACEDEMLSVAAGSPLVPFVASDLTAELVRELKMIEVPLVGTAGSAVHAAIQLGLTLGCEHIYLAGTDFGFPQDRLYATGAGTGDRFAVSSDGKSYSRQPLDSHFRAGRLIQVDANDGSVIAASLEMIKFREWVERVIAQQAEASTPVRFYNLARQGAVIAGAEFVDSICIDPNAITPKPAVESVLKMTQAISKIKLSDLPAKLRRRMDRIRALRESCNSVLDRASKGHDFFRDLERIQVESKKVIEVSTIMNEKLMTLDEYTDRVENRSRAESDQLLLGLIRHTRQAADDLLKVYSDVIRRLSAKV
jgi:hypothetical protein